MIGISKLYCGQVEPSDALRYGRESGNLPSHLLQFSKDKKPVVVWNMTKRCNLKCVHCYAQAVPVDGADDISTEQAKTMIDDLAAYGAPVMLFSGGEPLVRKDLVELASHATSKGMRAVISTNGTLITKEKARELKGVGLSYVGISLDGMEEVHDRFRGVPGAFRKALEGVANCQAEGLKVGLRFTINKRNVGEIPGIFRLLAPRLFLPPGVLGPRFRAHQGRPGSRRDPSGAGPHHGRDPRPVRRRQAQRDPHRGQPRRRSLCVDAHEA